MEHIQNASAKRISLSILDMNARKKGIKERKIFKVWETTLLFCSVSWQYEKIPSGSLALVLLS